jgi:transposase
MKCPKCEREIKQHKVGKNVSGSQRYRCYLCGCKYTPEKKKHAYDAEFRQKAIELYVDGMNLRRIGRHLGVHHQSVSNWVKGYAEKLPDAPVPDKVEKAEMDEIFTFIGDKKTESTSLLL